jgi:hypothetical protein
MVPLSTTVTSINCGVCPGSTQPDGEVIFATLTPESLELTRPTNSSIRFGRFPAAFITVGDSINRGILFSKSVARRLPPFHIKENTWPQPTHRKAKLMIHPPTHRAARLRAVINKPPVIWAICSKTNTDKLNPEPPTDITILEDDTDEGGPLIITSNDPDLNPPHVPIDPFPTGGTPEFDPPVKKN